MNNSTRRSLLAFLGLYAFTAGAHSVGRSRERQFRSRLLDVAATTAAGRPSTHGGGFVVFDGLLYSPMPDLHLLGMPKLLDAGNIWRQGVSHDTVDSAGVAAAVRFIRRFTDTYYFDLENWVMSDAPKSVIDASIQKLAQTAEIARTAFPDGKFGFYGVMPQTTYWPIVVRKADLLATWRDTNARSAVVAAKVDYLFPSLYTFYNDPAGWELVANTILTEARQYGKPVYPFLWPEFHDSNAVLRGQKIPRDFWRRQLEFCRQHADGLVLWGGYTETWEEQADWWVETKAFVESLRRPKPPTNLRHE
jgi:hypothetical protein